MGHIGHFVLVRRSENDGGSTIGWRKAAVIATLAAVLPLAGLAPDAGAAPKAAKGAKATAATSSSTTVPATTTTSTTTAPVVAELAPALALGVTHTQYSIEGTGESARSAAALLSSTPGALQNQHIMGFGARNPEPSPGVFDWTDLDKRVAKMRATGATPVITLCCSPDWMKGGEPGTTNWSYLEVAPKVEHFDEFAELSRQVALRYPDVKHFQVWNEMKGFWDTARNRWRYEDYTNLYNQVYTALKSVDPAIKVGGPYVHMQTLPTTNYYASTEVRGTWGAIDRRDLNVVSYWLAYAKGADFLTVDGSLTTKGLGLLTPEIEGQAKLGAVTRWLRKQSNLPVWWAELYATPYGNASALTEAQQAASLQAALTQLELAGATAALFWEPESRYGTTMPGLWSSTFGTPGGLPTLLHAVARPYMTAPQK
jgi:hypothetical protein